MFQDRTYSIRILGVISGTLTRTDLLGRVNGAAITLRWPILLGLATLVVLQVLFSFGRLRISASAAVFRGPHCLQEAQGNLTRGLSPRPVLEYVANILLAKVIVLFKGHMLGQVLWFNVIPSRPFEFRPWDPSLSLTNSDAWKSVYERIGNNIGSSRTIYVTHKLAYELFLVLQAMAVDLLETGQYWVSSVVRVKFNLGTFFLFPGLILAAIGNRGI